MSLKLKNQTGTLNLNYEIRHKRYADDNFAAVELWTGLPGQEMQYNDSVTEIRFNSYTDNLRAALTEAEERWNLKLLELTMKPFTLN